MLLAGAVLSGAVLLAVLLAGKSSRAMLASARLSCYIQVIHRRINQCLNLTKLFKKAPIFCFRSLVKKTLDGIAYEKLSLRILEYYF